MLTPEIAPELRILYGGSVNPENIKGLMSQRETDGVLVGARGPAIVCKDRELHSFLLPTGSRPVFLRKSFNVNEYDPYKD